MNSDDGHSTEIADAAEPEPETFPREVVERLRRENAKHRTDLRAAEERVERLAAVALVNAVTAHGTALQDPSDLAHFVKGNDLLDDDGAPDPDRIKAAAERLATEKPHLAARKVADDVGQGPRGDAPGHFDFSDVLQRAAQ